MKAGLQRNAQLAKKGRRWTQMMSVFLSESRLLNLDPRTQSALICAQTSSGRRYTQKTQTEFGQKITHRVMIFLRPGLGLRYNAQCRTFF